MGHIVGAMLAAASATAVLTGCAGEQRPPIGPGIYPALAGAEIATVGTPDVTDIPFGEALITYSQELSRLHAFQGEEADARIRKEVLALATILERMPAAAAEPELHRAASLIRAELASTEPTIEETKRALAVAAVALLMLAPREYRDLPEIAAQTREFAGAVSAIDADRQPPDRAGVIIALLRGERALATMYAANVAPPPPP